ncbi:HK97 family phage prohead protease [Pararhizobium sp. O133]|uniref:HK97 family phage prohead protease n=1 Tax=Pararhizobium sp. O133 TaxID=3449278 RepID=UPI003F6836E4
MTKDIEKRSGNFGVEVRAEGEKRTLTGYAVVWDSDTTIGDYFVERIAKNAFTKALRNDILALVNHDSGRVVGRTKSGTLRLAQDDHGLKVEIDVPDTTDGNDLWKLVERGDVSGMSFSFRATKQEWDESGEMPKRTVIEAELYEVTATPIPAYPDTTLALRSLEFARAETGRRINCESAARRISERRAATEQKIRGIRQDAS